VYCQNCYNEGHFIKDYELLKNICHIFKSINHNTNNGEWKLSLKGNGNMHVVQIKTLIIKK